MVLESLGYDESSSMVVGLPEWVDLQLFRGVLNHTPGKSQFELEML